MYLRSPFPTSANHRTVSRMNYLKVKKNILVLLLVLLGCAPGTGAEASVRGANNSEDALATPFDQACDKIELIAAANRGAGQGREKAVGASDDEQMVDLYDLLSSMYPTSEHFRNGSSVLTYALSTLWGAEVTVNVTSTPAADGAEVRKLIEQPIARPGCCQFRYFGHCRQYGVINRRKTVPVTISYSWLDSTGQADARTRTSEYLTYDIEICDVSMAVLSVTMECCTTRSRADGLNYQFSFAGSGGGTWDDSGTRPGQGCKEVSDSRYCAAT